MLDIVVVLELATCVVPVKLGPPTLSAVVVEACVVLAWVSVAWVVVSSLVVLVRTSCQSGGVGNSPTNSPGSSLPPMPGATKTTTNTTTTSTTTTSAAPTPTTAIHGRRLTLGSVFCSPVPQTSWKGVGHTAVSMSTACLEAATIADGGPVLVADTPDRAADDCTQYAGFWPRSRGARFEAVGAIADHWAPTRIPGDGSCAPVTKTELKP
mmetsp:Transcript_71901/g.201784  ORF Transcript_71901/g.201784 Transcript_71901/m.201784 type:complete len:210 (+) Transcript_71901:557-1186(+)